MTSLTDCLKTSLIGDEDRGRLDALTAKGMAPDDAVLKIVAEIDKQIEAAVSGRPPEKAVVKETVEVTINGKTDTVAKSPSKEQIEANTYKKGHYSINGLSTTVETAAGERRKPEWPPLKDSYGDIKYTIGAEGEVGEGVDVFYNNQATDDEITSRNPIVVDQYKDNGKGGFDEHKVILGAKSAINARGIYGRNYKIDWKGGKDLTEFTWEEFKKWVLDPKNTSKPAAEYKQTADVEVKESAKQGKAEKKAKGAAEKKPDYAQYDGKQITYEAETEDTGEVFDVTVDAGVVMREVDGRLAALKELRDCL